MQDQRLYSFFRSHAEENHFVTTNSDAALKEVMKRLRKSECAIVVICTEIFRDITPLYDDWKKKLYQEKVIREAKVQSISMLPILSNPQGPDLNLMHIHKILAQEDSIVVLKGLHQMHYNPREASYFFQKLKRQTENMTFLSPLVLITTNRGLFRLIQADVSYRRNTIWLILDEEYRQYVPEENPGYTFQESFHPKQKEEPESTFLQRQPSFGVVEKTVPSIQETCQNDSPTETEEQKTTKHQPGTEPEEHIQERQPCPTEPESFRQPEGQGEENVTEKHSSDVGNAKTNEAEEKKNPICEQENADPAGKENDVPADTSFSPENCPSETEPMQRTADVPKSTEQVSRIKREILRLLGYEKKSDLFEKNLFSNEIDAPWYCSDEELFDREMEGIDYIEKKFGILVCPHIEGKNKRLVCSMTMGANGQDVGLSIIYEPHYANNNRWAAFFVDDYKNFKKLFRKAGVQPLNDKERRDLFVFDENTLSDYYHRAGHPSTSAAIIEIFIDTFCQGKNNQERI